MRGDKSFADDFDVGAGVVSGRVALLLRSAETKPVSPRFVERHLSPSGCSFESCHWKKVCLSSGRVVCLRKFCCWKCAKIAAAG